MERFSYYFNQYAISVLLSLVGLLMVASCVLVIINGRTMDEALETQELSDAISQELREHLDVIREMDVALRGFALSKKESYLYKKPLDFEKQMESTFDRIDSLLEIQNYSHRAGLKALKDYQNTLRMLHRDFTLMVEYLRADNDSAFFELFNLDKGSALGPPIDNTNEFILGYQETLKQRAIQRYKSAERSNLIIQIIMLILGIPSVILVLFRLSYDRKQRRSLLNQLQENNRTYLFNDGEQRHVSEAKEIVENSINDLQKASKFVASISQGNFKVNWEGMTEEHKEINKNTFAGMLVNMKEQLQKVKEEDELRNWSNENFGKMLELLRSSNDLELISDKVLSYLIENVKANQGMIFMVQDEEDEELKHLKLLSAYAYDRKKYMDLKVNPGEGLVGQVWLEGKKLFLKEVPEDYTDIKSGTGSGHPKNVLIIPLIYDEKLQGVLELASLFDFEEHHIGLVERVSENIAATFYNLKINQVTKLLLEQSQVQSEEMKAQEEEMRQNMEELEATQEEMRRKEQGYIEEINELKKALGKE